jgi:hypothetical protein
MNWQSGLPDGRRALMIILKHSAGILGLIAVGVALGMNYEIVWELLAEFVPLVFEAIENSLDTFFEVVVRLNPAFAQMATAYFGFVIAIILLYFLGRKSIGWWHRIDAAYTAWKQTYFGAWNDWSLVQKTRFLAWWDTLDWGNKVMTVLVGVLLGIPLALVLSIALGSLVASFL